jgi:hypothetical protein
MQRQGGSTAGWVVSKKKVKDYLEERRRRAIERTLVQLSGLESSIKDIRKSAADPQSRWSVNHDVLRWAQNLHRNIYELHVLSNLYEEINKPSTREKKKK